MWTHDAEDVDDARGLRKEDGDVTTPRMSLRQRRRRSRHRASLFLGTCVALAVAFAMLRSGVREHRGARDRVDGGVDGDYEAHAGEPFEERAPPESLGGVRPGADPDSTTTGASFSETHEAIRASMRRGAVVKQHRNSDTDEAGSGSGATIDPFAIRSTPKPEETALGALFRFFGAERVSLGAAFNAEDASALKIKSRRRVARLHVTRDPSTGHLTMNDVGAGAFAVSQPRACAPIASEADGEADSVAGAMVTLRTAFRVGKILRRCDAVSVVAFRFGASEKSSYRYRGGEEYVSDDHSHSRDIRDEKTQKQKKLLALGDAETLLRDLNEGTLYGPVCYTPDFLRGVASTLSVCSRNHEDGVALALLGFAGVGGNEKGDETADSEKKEKSLRPRLLVSVSDAIANAPERGASAYLVHNHRFRGAFVDARGDAAAARRAHFRNRGVPTSGDGDGGGVRDTRRSSGAVAACVRGRVETTTVGAEIRGALALALEGKTRVEAEASGDKKKNAETRDASDASDDETDTGDFGSFGSFGKKTHSGASRRVEIDLLTLDVQRDGLYLVQPALLTVSPRVIAASYDSAFGPERALAANPSSPSREPVREPFVSDKSSSGTESDALTDVTTLEKRASSRAYRRDGSTFGKSNVETFSEQDKKKRTASLSAYVKALERWGFHFVGCEAAGETAFFLRADVIEAAHRAGRGSVHVTTPEDSGCFSARGPRMAMREWAMREAERVSEGGENAEFTEVNEAWLAAHAPGMPWREDDAFLADAEELRR